MHTHDEHSAPDADAARKAMESIRRIVRAVGAHPGARRPASGEAFVRRFEQLADWEQMHLLAALQRVGTMMGPREEALPASGSRGGRYVVDAKSESDDGRGTRRSGWWT
jgi:hypothetical protein